MNLQPLFDLKERLEYAAIAGTGLLHEDFRLRRAIDALAPLAAASTVFARISTSAKALIDAPVSERCIRLLDVLSLVDAVVYTQGVTNVSGELIPLECGVGRYVHAPYSRLQPLIQALSGAGSGRMSLIQAAWKETPEIFGDFRVLPHVVGMLGESYGELAAEILRAQGRNVVPLLKDSFDPAGKRVMVRRVQLVVQLSGSDENEWFVSQIPESKKDVREALILALGCCQSNAQLLIDLCHSERGKMKEAALRALAQMESPICQELLRKEIVKKPESYLGCLEGVNTSFTADLMAEAFSPNLSALAKEIPSYSQSQLTAMVESLQALRGKYSPAMRHRWLEIAAEVAQMCADKSHQGSIPLLQGLIQNTFLYSILWNPCDEMFTLAQEMAIRCEKWFLSCRLLADMLERPADSFYDIYAPKFAAAAEMISAFSLVHWDEQRKEYCLRFQKLNPLTGVYENAQLAIAGLDSRWASLLIEYCANAQNVNQEQFESTLIRIIRPDDADLCAVIGQYLYDRLVESGGGASYLEHLIRCGWTQWKGLMPRMLARHKNDTGRIYMIRYLLDHIPMRNGDKAEDLRTVDAMMQKLNIRLWDSDQVQIMIAQLEANPDAING